LLNIDYLGAPPKIIEHVRDVEYDAHT